ncbi:MAG: hypothetical protein FWB85_05090 [Chitinispirillia bacterium]|nr:hypothetical protein [Chitinispirillia bacterium]
MSDMKKFILVIASIMITAMAFTACNRGSSAAKQTDFSIYGVWRHIGGADVEHGGTWTGDGAKTFSFFKDGENVYYTSSGSGNSIWQGVLEDMGDFRYTFNPHTQFNLDKGTYFDFEVRGPYAWVDVRYDSEKKRLVSADHTTEEYYEWAGESSRPDPRYFTLTAASSDPNAKILNGDLSDFSAYWINGRGVRPWLNSDGTFSSNQTASGFRKHGDAYTWNVSQGESGGFGVILYPVGVDVELGNRIIETDKTKVRLTSGHDLPDDPKDYFYLESEIGASPLIAIIQIGFSRDKNFTFRKVHEFEDKGNLGDGITITSDITIKDFSFIAVDYDYEADSWIVERTLFTIPELKSSEHSEAFQANTNVGDGKPSRGITFIDGNTRRYFYISESGVDGSLSLTEFQLRK